MQPVAIRCAKCGRDYVIQNDEVNIVLYHCPTCDHKDIHQTRVMTHPGTVLRASKIAFDPRQPRS